MASTPAHLVVHEPNKIIRKKKLRTGQHKREDLEREVTMLRTMLDHQQKVHEILERVHRRNDRHSALSIPNFLPPKAKELLAELAMVEHEISRLETQIGQLQTDLHREKETNKEYKFEQLHHAALNNQRGFSSLPSPRSNPSALGASERVPFETKSLHFISKAIKGDYNANDFSIKEKLMGNLRAMISDHKENNFQKEAVGIRQLDEKLVSRKSGMLKPISPSPLREPTHPSPRRQSNAEVSSDLPPKPIPSPVQQQSEEESTQKLPPNKLAENIMKCLIFIFVRLLRTSRAMELEKSGAISRSANFPLSSRSFRVDTSSNISKASSLIQRESKQQDPYGIFNSEESIPRDIGPYKNLVMFTARNLDPKCISNSSSIPLVQKLRVLMTSLQIVDLRFLNHQQKLAFWINMYNACIMHGFLQYGVPSSSENLLTLMNKATLNIGGNIINAHTIEHFILRKPAASSIFKEVCRKGDREDKEVMVRELYGLESSDPNVAFSLCCGTRSSPAVRIYTPEGLAAELEKSKLEYLQASILVTSRKRIALPELLLQKMHDFTQDMDSLVEWVCHQLPASGSLRKSLVDCFRNLIASGGKVSAIVDKIPYDFEFQYLLYV
ncbi:uncharacterized protein LOC131314939 isoform X1 [Rhododendron vialii]|uniref:uncharacterized protein LOC131314939 isoform X1 n=2 Tax=Rhododendron vialii TaxID=182163 RepID=UPI00265DE7D4|nr:uncharacterized protein LOC131314939 isoform X1 [Rhododendron vialii]